jgi:hypothetical protein
MNKYLVVILAVLGLASCTTKDEAYYRSNPKELQQAMKGCPQQTPEGVTCQQIEILGNRINNLAYQLQYNPQGFGHKILSLQQTIAGQEIELKTDKATPELKANLAQNKHDLVELLAVVKWLESPES